MIQAIQQQHGRPSAICVCDECSAEIEVACDYLTTRQGKWLPNEGQILRKIGGLSWTNIKGKLRCAKCSAERKAKRETAVMSATVETIRQPTREQIREIIQMLEVVYDSKLGRYSGHETDASVAKSMGAGIMPGWVAAERERAFGPAGGNEELETLCHEVEAYRIRVKTLEASVVEELKGLNAMSKRLDALKKAVGVKAVNV